MILGSAPVPYISVWVLIPSILEGGEVIADALVSGTPGSGTTTGSGSTTTGSGSTTTGSGTTTTGSGTGSGSGGGGGVGVVAGCGVAGHAQAGNIRVVVRRTTTNSHLVIW